MRFKVNHTTRYAYSRPVFLEPHTLRLRPHSNASQELTHFKLAVEPKPSVWTEATDAEGNDIAHAWFDGLSESLVVKSTFEVETLRLDPFDFILLESSARSLPLEYPADSRGQLAPYLANTSRGDGPVAEYARSVSEWAGGETLPFLSVLNERISSGFEVIIRENGEPVPAEVTLQSQQGACRDLAVLFMECCRRVGIASRFVSGYQVQSTEPDAAQAYMHAWAEVYLPGAGWRGYDSTQGLAVADGHVAVAASAVPQLAAPISGSFRGTGVFCSMEAEIAVTASDTVTPRP